ncbi:hypothetical protein FQA47_014142 [Oryzias melastigma]|uniref:Uncharacterized protein n=1 Tax=Oryzias melastigma TaxID=30732 RepID=A0A834EYH9_ORYME|nr:hypothetical protein FQA47_014142 [Oryzias melastigma]
MGKNRKHTRHTQLHACPGTNSDTNNAVAHLTGTSTPQNMHRRETLKRGDLHHCWRNGKTSTALCFNIAEKAPLLPASRGDLHHSLR